MPRMKLNRTNIDKQALLTEQGRVDYWDSGEGSVKGFGLRVGKTSKVFFVQIDVTDTGATGGKKYRTLKATLGILDRTVRRRRSPSI